MSSLKSISGKPKFWRPFEEDTYNKCPEPAVAKWSQLSFNCSSGPIGIAIPKPLYPSKVCVNVHSKCTIDLSGKKANLIATGSSSFHPVKRKRVTCPHCPSKFFNNGQLSGHLTLHNRERPFRCTFDKCPRSFARNEELTRHLRIHTGDKPHICDLCPKRFGRKDHLSKHRRTHQKLTEKKVHLCRIEGCGHSYTRSDALARHVGAAHQNLRNSSKTQETR